MDVDARLSALEAENERLLEEIVRLQEAFGITDELAPIALRLTGKECALLGILMKRDTCTKQQIMSGLYAIGPDEEPEVKIVDVFVCKMRKKLKPFGIEVDTVWGQGYRLTPAAKAIVSNLYAQERAA